MSGEIELISDGDGIAVIGDATTVDAFLASEGLPSIDLRLERLRGAAGTAATALQAVSQISAELGTLGAADH